MFFRARVRAISLLTYPSILGSIGMGCLYGAIGALLYDGTTFARSFDDRRWSAGILFGWPTLYWLVVHGFRLLK